MTNNQDTPSYSLPSLDDNTPSKDSKATTKQEETSTASNEQSVPKPTSTSWMSATANNESTPSNAAPSSNSTPSKANEVPILTAKDRGALAKIINVIRRHKLKKLDRKYRPVAVKTLVMVQDIIYITEDESILTKEELEAMPIDLLTGYMDVAIETLSSLT